MNLDYAFQYATRAILEKGTLTSGRTDTDRIRLLEGIEFSYDCRNGNMSAFTLRKNDPNLAIAETLAFIMGAHTVTQLEKAHPGLKLWSAWASDSGSLGGVYGDAFVVQYPKILHGLKNNPTSTHHRMTTLLPSYFPRPGYTYSQNVSSGRYSLMPCLHSYHFLSDGEYLFLHATQASGDIPVGVFPHNAYQVQAMLLITAHLTGLKPKGVRHHVHDAHIYQNQIEEVEKLQLLWSKNQSISLAFSPDFSAETLFTNNFSEIRNWVQTSEFKTHPALKIKVDS